MVITTNETIDLMTFGQKKQFCNSTANPIINELLAILINQPQYELIIDAIHNQIRRPASPPPPCLFFHRSAPPSPALSHELSPPLLASSQSPQNKGWQSSTQMFRHILTVLPNSTNNPISVFTASRRFVMEI